MNNSKNLQIKKVLDTRFFKMLKMSYFLIFKFDVDEFRSLPVPGFGSARLGVAYVRVTDIPAALDASQIETSK